jgi:putative transposase
MKGKLRTVEEKVRILRQADGERTILEICDEHNVSEQTFYRRKKGFGLLDVKQAQRLKELEEENGRLKSIVADQGFGMEILQEALEKKVVNPGHKRQVAQGFVAEGRCSGPTACQYFSLHRSTYRYAAKELNGWQKRLRAAVRSSSLKKRKRG